MATTYPPALACNASTIPVPTVFGAEILSLTANVVSNFSALVSEQVHPGHPTSSVSGIDFCNITVTYTHPGQNDEIHVVAWLPIDNWNGNLQAVGGGGYAAGLDAMAYMGMAGAMGEGYATSSTDAGVPVEGLPLESAFLLSPGNVNLYAVQNLASVSLKDQVCTLDLPTHTPTPLCFITNVLSAQITMVSKVLTRTWNTTGSDNQSFDLELLRQAS